MSDDYFWECQQARVLGEMRAQRERARCEEKGITPEMKKAAGEEIDALYVGLSEQSPAEQLRRYRRMYECANVRGYIYDPDPIFDLVRMRAIDAEMDRLVELTGSRPIHRQQGRGR